MLYVLLILLTSHYASVLTLSAPYYDLKNATQYFEEFIKKYDIHYADEEEKEARFKIFKDNLADVNRLNAESSTRRSGEASAVFAVTQFMDITHTEFRKRYTGFQGTVIENPNCGVVRDEDIPNRSVPDSFDWRDEGVLSRVKNQGTCQSCYAFSVTGYLEAQSAIKKNQFVELSEQQIVDCDKGSFGCDRGIMSHAFWSIIEQGGIMSAEDYPYEGRTGVCAVDPSRVVLQVDKCNTYQLRSQEKVKQLVYEVGPIVIAVSASNFQTYNGGVFNDEQCDGILNHAVLLVGYGTDPVYGPYWVIKNSYGPSFGEGGFIRVQRGEGAGSCGLMNGSMSTASIV